MPVRIKAAQAAGWRGNNEISLLFFVGQQVLCKLSCRHKEIFDVSIQARSVFVHLPHRDLIGHVIAVARASDC